MPKQVRGEKIIYEEIIEGDICNGCVWNPIGGSCVLYKYRSPAICKGIRERLEEWKSKPHISPDRSEISVVKVLSIWNYKTGEKRFTYYEVKDNISQIVWVRKSSRTKYERYLSKKRREAKDKINTLLKYVAPANPW